MCVFASASICVLCVCVRACVCVCLRLSVCLSVCLQKDYSPPICSSKNEDDHRKRVAIRLLRCGELSRAAKALTSQGLAPANDETLNKLRSNHPSRRDADCAMDLVCQVLSVH